jgi:hypothetical protein
MSQAPPEPVSLMTIDGKDVAKSKLAWGNVVAIAMVTLLIIAFTFGIWQLRPKETPIGRPIGEAGKVQAFALPANPAGEGFAIWRDGRQVYALPNDQAMSYQRIELSSNDVDIAGSSAPDLVLYGWTGGAHCCFTQILVDGQSGRVLGKLELGNGDPMPFMPAPKAGYARAVGVNFDDVSAYQFGSYADSPMARILAIWDGKRFSLDLRRMAASRADSPPAYYTAEPELGDAVPLGVMETGESEDNPAPALQPNKDGGPRGDRAKTYQTWMEDEEARMRATALNGGDETSFGPMAAFLNERIYKGQASAGVATVLEAYDKTPEVRSIAIAYYFDVLAKSRWLEDLNRLNNGQLKTLMATHSQPPPALKTDKALPRPSASP